MHSITKARVAFFKETKVTTDNKITSTLTTPNKKVVQQLALKNAPDARIGFDTEGTVIYAKMRGEPQKARILWEKAIGRW